MKKILGKIKTAALLFAISSTPALAAVIDDFSSATLNGWTIVNEGTTSAPSNWSIQSGELRQNTNIYGGSTGAAGLPKPGTYALYDAGTGWSDYQISATLRGVDDDAIGVMFRYQDSDNYYRFSMDTSRAYRRLVKKQAGVFTVLWQDSVAYTRNQNYQFSANIVGSNISISLDGTELVSVSDNGISQGSVALYCWGQQGVFFDNVDVALATGGDLPPNMTVIEPALGSYLAGTAVSLSAVVNDPEEGDLSTAVQWQSSLDGLLATGNTTLSTLSIGAHTLTATVIDSGGNTASKQQSVIITPPLTTVLNADFDNNDLSNWAIIDEGTTSAPSNWSIQAGELRQNTNIYGGSTGAAGLPKPGSFAWYLHGAGWTDYQLSVDMRSTDDDALGVMFRYVDANNYYRFSMDTSRSYRRLVKKVNGVFTVLYEDAVKYTINQTYQLQVTALGNVLTVSLDGELLSTVSDSSLQQGSIALYNWGNTGSYFDNLVVEAFDAVPTNTAPVIAASQPANGSSFTEGNAITFAATATDNEDGNISNSILWASDISGVLGSGSSITVPSLAIGNHTITLSVADSGGLSASASLNVVVSVNAPPVVSISTPPDASEYIQGSTVVFTGTATDPEDGDISAFIQWSSDIDGTLGSGASISVSTLGVGVHAITATVVDSQGAINSTSKNILVSFPNSPPSVSIVNPLSAISVIEGSAITFAATASDTEDGDLSASVQWQSSRDGLIGSGASISLNTLTVGSHIISASVTDAGTATQTASVNVTITANTAPVLTIIQPGSNTTVDVGANVDLQATATDNEEGDLGASIRWASDIDGELGFGTNLSVNTLTEGVHGITASVTDSQGLLSLQTIVVTVNAISTTPKTIAYKHNALGQRISKTQDGVTTYFVYDTSGQLIAELDNNATVTREYLYSDLGHLATVENVGPSESLYFVHSDHLGTPRRVTDSNQQVVWAARYEPFGGAEIVVNTIDQNFRFPGQYYDAETGLHYNYFRDYDPSLGRYVQSDPIGLGGGINTYGYVEGNPVKFVDPLGLEKLILLNPSKSIRDLGLYNTATRMPDIDGTLSVVAHSDGKTFVDLNGNRIDPLQLANVIKNSGQWQPNMPVQLLACSAGAGGNSSAASQLANHLNTNVTAANTYVWLYANGNHRIGKLFWLAPAQPFTQNGKWITSYPTN